MRLLFWLLPAAVSALSICSPSTPEHCSEEQLEAYAEETGIDLEDIYELIEERREHEAAEGTPGVAQFRDHDEDDVMQLRNVKRPQVSSQSAEDELQRLFAAPLADVLAPGYAHVTEVVEQVYMFPLLTPEAARLLVAACERHGDEGGWHETEDVFRAEHGRRKAVDGAAGAEAGAEAGADEASSSVRRVTLANGTEVEMGRVGRSSWPRPSLETANAFSSLDEWYYALAQAVIVPHIEALWDTFEVQRLDEPSVLRYIFPTLTEMKFHHDAETVSSIVYLNDEFEGGGTSFPRWNYSTGKPPIGTAIIYPGAVSHEHVGLKITDGRRYLMLGAFF